MHQDISIGNVMAMAEREERPAFAVNAECKLEAKELIKRIKVAAKDLKLSKFETDVSVFMTRLTAFTKKQLASAQCAGFIGDADIAKNWKVMFRRWNKDTVSKSHLSVCSRWLGCGHQLTLIQGTE